MSTSRSVKKVTIEFADGEIEEVDGTKFGMFYRAMRTCLSREKNAERVWLDHEIRWTDRDQVLSGE